MTLAMSDVPVFEAVTLGFPRDPHYARVTYSDGRTLHVGPWRSYWAAQRCALLYMRAWAMRTRSIGNGDTCPINPAHGAMFALPTSTGRAPQQYCPNVDHDGRPRSQFTPERIERSRAIWPIHGFDESVAAYFARTRTAPVVLPDLSDLEVAL